MNLSESVRRRFWANVAKCDDRECWLWTAKARHKFGYGAMNIEGKVITAHRIAFAIEHGSIPPQAHILHTCDVPACCNPKHLYAGTDAQNKADMISRGRQRKGGHSAETIKKIKAGRAANPPHYSVERRAATASRMSARWKNPEWRESFSKQRSGANNPAFGKPIAPERMAAIVAANKARAGRKLSEATKQKMRIAAQNRRGTS